MDIGNLSIESSDSDLIPSQSLAMRGSWRLALNRHISSSRLETLMAIEYAKKLK